MLTTMIVVQLKENGILHGFLREWRFKMLLSCQIMNMERRFVFIIPVRMPGMLLMVIRGK